MIYGLVYIGSWDADVQEQAFIVKSIQVRKHKTAANVQFCRYLLFISCERCIPSSYVDILVQYASCNVIFIEIYANSNFVLFISIFIIITLPTTEMQFGPMTVKQLAQMMNLRMGMKEVVLVLSCDRFY